MHERLARHTKVRRAPAQIRLGCLEPIHRAIVNAGVTEVDTKAVLNGPTDEEYGGVDEPPRMDGWHIWLRFNSQADVASFVLEYGGEMTKGE